MAYLTAQLHLQSAALMPFAGATDVSRVTEEDCWSRDAMNTHLPFTILLVWWATDLDCTTEKHGTMRTPSTSLT
jgi:hypothetical protein